MKFELTKRIIKYAFLGLLVWILFVTLSSLYISTGNVTNLLDDPYYQALLVYASVIAIIIFFTPIIVTVIIDIIKRFYKK